MQYCMLFIERRRKASGDSTYSDRLKRSEWVQGLTIETASYSEGSQKAISLKPDVVVDDGQGDSSGWPLMIRSELRRSGFFGPIVLLVDQEEPGPTFTHENRVADQLVYAPFNYLLGTTDMFVERSRKFQRAEQVDSLVRLGDLTLDLLTGETLRVDHSVFLSVTDFELLLFMVRNAGRILSERDLARAGHGESVNYMNNYSIVVGVQIGHLKLNIEPEGTAPMIHSADGLGYLIKAVH